MWWRVGMRGVGRVVWGCGMQGGGVWGCGVWGSEGGACGVWAVGCGRVL